MYSLAFSLVGKQIMEDHSFTEQFRREKIERL